MPGQKVGQKAIKTLFSSFSYLTIRFFGFKGTLELHLENQKFERIYSASFFVFSAGKCSSLHWELLERLVKGKCYESCTCETV